MSDNRPWEPDPKQVGHKWTDMFNPAAPHNGEARAAAEPPPKESAAHDGAADESPDAATYRPWLAQRGRARPVLMLGLRRFEARSGMWQGWAMPYAGLYAVEYLGGGTVSLDFGARQFVIEGSGLDELALRIQQGEVTCVQEYAAAVWPTLPAGAVVRRIRRVVPEGAMMG
ncbi:MAG: hypothetical protein LBF16_03435 [Pseudomonadales bacterium]|jgi:hypothetical protein|nr:hypothetical protein [Pseudomonadales bacterium]